MFLLFFCYVINKRMKINMMDNGFERQLMGLNIYNIMFFKVG